MTNWEVFAVVWYCIGIAFFVGLAMRGWKNLMDLEEDDDQ